MLATNQSITNRKSVKTYGAKQQQQLVAIQRQSYRLGRGRGRGPDCLPAGREGAEQAVDETAAGGRGDRQRGGGDWECSRDPAEAQKVLERMPASRIHSNAATQRSAMVRTSAHGAATRRGAAEAGRSGVRVGAWSGEEGSESGGRHAILRCVCFAWRGGFTSVPSGSRAIGTSQIWLVELP